MRARPRPAIRLLLLLQAEQRTGRLLWRVGEGERALLLAAGLVVGTEGQPESFLEYLARACRIPPSTLGRIERRVRDLFLPLEGEIARATGLTPEEIAASRRDFAVLQIADLCLREDDPLELRFEEDALPVVGAACQVPPATALADLLLERQARDLPPSAFPPRTLRPTRLFPRLAVLLEPAFPWQLPLPQAGGEPAADILARCGADRTAALWLLVAGSLLAEEPSQRDRRRPAAILPGMAFPAMGGPLATLEALEERLSTDPFNQEAIEALERLAAEEGWPEVLMEVQERLIAKAPPPQRGYYFLRLAALADVARLPGERHAEIVSLGRRSLPRDSRLACAQAFEIFRRGDQEGAKSILSAAGVAWPPAGSTGTLELETVLAPAVPSQRDLSLDEDLPSSGRPRRPTWPGPMALPAEAPGPELPPEAPATPPVPAAVVASPPEPAAPPPAPQPPPTTVLIRAPAPEPPVLPSDDATFEPVDVLPDSLGPLMAALRDGDDDTLHAWLRTSLPELPRVRRASQAVLDAAQAPGAEGTDRVARFARALGRALDELPRPASGETTNLQADLFVQLADVLGPVDRAAALVAAERAVRTSPDHEPAQEKLERLAIEARDADAYARGFAGIEDQIEGAHNKWAFAYRQGRTLETEFARNDLALAAYLRALNYQPRSGAVLTAIERLAKLLANQDALVEAYRLLAGASDGAQRAYWRSRLAELGVVGKVDDQDSGWGDLLEESAPTGRAAARAAAAAPPPAQKPGEPTPANAAPPPAAARTAPLPAPPVAAGASTTPAATAAKETSGGEPARGIEEAILRATPALGIPILHLTSQALDSFAPAAPAAPLPAPPRRSTPVPPAPPIQVVPAAVPRDAVRPAIPATPTPPVEAEPGAPPHAATHPAIVSMPAEPTVEAEPAAPPAAPPPRLQRAARSLPPAPAESSPVMPARARVPFAATILPSDAPDTSPSDAPTAAAPTAPPPVVPEQSGKGAAAPAQDEAPSKDVSWLDEDVEMIIEYPTRRAARAAPAAEPARAPLEPPPGPVPGAMEPPAGAATIPAEPQEAQVGASSHEDKPAPPSRTRTTSSSVPAIAIGEPEEVREARVRLEADATDLEALRVLRDHWHAGGSTIAAWAADSVQAVFDPAVAPVMPPAAVPTLAEVALSRCGPWDARFMHRAMAVVWEHCASTFAEELPSRVRPAQQVSPLGAEPLSRAIAECSDKLAFFRFQVYRQADGDEVHVLRTRPPSVLVGASVDPTKPLDRTRLAVAVARCIPEHLLPSTLSPMEREALLQGLLCAFGPPGCVPRIAQRAATVAQDLWHFVPTRVQAMMRTELAAADVADTGAWLTEVHARCLLLGVRVSRDLRGAVRLGLSLDAAIPPERPLGEAEFREGLRWSSVTRRLLRAVLSEGFWQGFGR